MNFLKIKSSSLRFCNYLYLDDRNYKIDSIAINKHIPLTFLPFEWGKEDSRFRLCAFKTRKKYKNIIEDELFPELHKTLWGEYGGDYLDECNTFELIYNDLHSRKIAE